MIKTLYIGCVFALFVLSLQAEQQTPLGLPVEIADVYIKGTEVEPIPRSDQSSSLVIRILAVKPADDGFRYDMSIYGLDPGSYQINNYLQYKDSRQKVAVADSVGLEITNRHPLSQLPKPQEIEHDSVGKLGGYRTSLIVIGVLWLIGLLLILFYRRRQQSEIDSGEKPLTLHEKLQVLVSAAARGELDDDQLAQLERLIIGHWKTKLPELDSMSTVEALTKLRSHPEASPLILKLERWLHAPSVDTNQNEIAEMLAPFQTEELNP